MNWELRKQIHEKCGSQVDFAHLVKCNETLISKVVRGRRNLAIDKQLEWAQALGCRPEDIFREDSV